MIIKLSTTATTQQQQQQQQQQLPLSQNWKNKNNRGAVPSRTRDTLFFFKIMGHTRPLFLFIFVLFSHPSDKYSTNLTINEKSIDDMLGSGTQGGRMEVADESTELWRHPRYAVWIKPTAILFIINCIEMMKIKRKEAGNGPFVNNITSKANGINGQSKTEVIRFASEVKDEFFDTMWYGILRWPTKESWDTAIAGSKRNTERERERERKSNGFWKPKTVLHKKTKIRKRRSRTKVCQDWKRKIT